jgi:hypothetical protein
MVVYQDLRLAWLTSHDPGIPELGSEVVGEQTVAQLIQRLAELFRSYLQGHPRRITTRQVIALRPRNSTLALLRARQLL